MREPSKNYREKQESSSKSMHHLTLSSIAISALIAALLVDSLLSDVSSIVNRVLSESTRIVLFSTIAGITILSGSYVVTNYSKRLKAYLGSKSKLLPLVYRVMPPVQYSIMLILLIITLQIIFTHQYLTL